jgi:DNA (cytosine-5)-methyltransferase 1
MTKKLIAVDLFCGAGGETTGMIEAFKEAGKEYEMLAINHWDIAIETHSKNHPEVKHKCESIQTVDPWKAIPGGRVHVLWASPECTHHSRARGGKPCSDQSRASAWLVLKWVQELYVDRLYIENVPEFLDWGPLGASGKPLKSKKGQTFIAFVTALESLGYRVDWRIMNAANYGAPTTRRRVILQAVRGKNKIAWPAETHTQEPDMFASERWVPAKDIIDWNVKSKSIFNRKKPLAENTLKRIETGIKKYWGEWAEPFLVILRGQSKTREINQPLPTVSCGGIHAGIVEPFFTKHYGTGTTCDMKNPLPTVTAGGVNFGLVEPFLTRYNGGEDRNHSINEPVPVLDCSNRYGVVEPFIMATGHTSSKDRSKSIHEPLSTVVTKAEHCLVEPLILHQMSGVDCVSIHKPLPTITTRCGHALVEPFLLKYYSSGENAESIGKPLGTVTTKDRFALVEGCKYTLDIRFRMLKWHELAAATSFPKDYKFSGNSTQKVKQIGNAVPPIMAKAIIAAGLAA